MATLQIRDLPEEVYTALSRRAARERRSLAQQAVVELARMSDVQVRERRLRVLDEVRAVLARSGPRTLPTAPEALVREDRDR
jgi:antitoxin FitA